MGDRGKGAGHSGPNACLIPSAYSVPGRPLQPPPPPRPPTVQCRLTMGIFAPQDTHQRAGCVQGHPKMNSLIFMDTMAMMV